MAHVLHRGEIWMYAFAPPDKRRPVLVLSRPQLLIERLHQVTVAAITSTPRSTSLEVAIGVEEGLKHPCVVNLVNIYNVPRAALHSYVGKLSPEKMREVCRALIRAVGCDG
jgi:mRNA interferase MazF